MDLVRNLSLGERLAVIAGLVAAVASLVGFVPGVYRDTHALVVQSNGQDAATLIFGLPVLVVGLWAANRGSVRGRVVVLGALAYLLYTYATYSLVAVVGPATVLHIAVVGLSAWAILVTLAAPGGLVDDADATIGKAMPWRATATYMFVVAILFAFAWLGQIGGAVLSGSRPQALIDAGWPTSPIYTFDLAIVLPLMTLAGWWLARGRRGAATLAVPLLVFSSILCIGILTMSAFALFDNQPLDPVLATIFALTAVLGAALAARSLLHRDAAVVGSGKAARTPVSA